MAETDPIQRKTLKDLGLDETKYPTCSRPVKGQNVGCLEFFRCQIKEKKDPCYKGVALYKSEEHGVDANGQKIREVRKGSKIMSCFHIPAAAEILKLNGGNLKVVADEGQAIRLKVSKMVDFVVPGELTRQIERTTIEEVKVPAYHDQIELLNDAISAQELRAEEELVEKEEFDALERDAKAGPARRRG